MEQAIFERFSYVRLRPLGQRAVDTASASRHSIQIAMKFNKTRQEFVRERPDQQHDHGILCQHGAVVTSTAYARAPPRARSTCSEGPLVKLLLLLLKLAPARRLLLRRRRIRRCGRAVLVTCLELRRTHTPHRTPCSFVARPMHILAGAVGEAALRFRRIARVSHEALKCFLVDRLVPRAVSLCRLLRGKRA